MIDILLEKNHPKLLYFFVSSSQVIGHARYCQVKTHVIIHQATVTALQLLLVFFYAVLLHF